MLLLTTKGASTVHGTTRMLRGGLIDTPSLLSTYSSTIYQGHLTLIALLVHFHAQATEKRLRSKHLYNTT